MDSERFDHLARVFGHAGPRRQALRGLAGAAAAGALAVSGREASAGRCKPNGRACKTSDQCCSDTCAANTGKGSARTCQAATATCIIPCPDSENCCNQIQYCCVCSAGSKVLGPACADKAGDAAASCTALEGTFTPGITCVPASS